MNEHVHREWNGLVSSLKNAECPVERRVRDVDGLQQLLDVLTSTPPQQTSDTTERLKLVAYAIEAVQGILDDTQPSVEGSEGNANVGVLRTACLQLLFKLQRATGAFPSAAFSAGLDFRTLSDGVFNCSHRVLVVDNDVNGIVCCKLIGLVMRHRMQIRERERKLAQDPNYTPQPDTALPELMRQLLTTLTQWLEHVPSLCSAAVQMSKDPSDRQQRGSRSFKTIAELLTTVKDTVWGFTKVPALVELAAKTWPMALAALAVELPAEGAEVSAALVANWSHLQSRVLLWVHTLISTNVPTLAGGTPELIQHCMWILRTSAVTAPSHREILTNIRMIFSKVLRTCEVSHPCVQEIHKQLPHLLEGGHFFAREPVYSNRAHAYSIATDLLLAAREHLPVPQLRSSVWVFMLELLHDDSLHTLATQVKCAETVMKVLDYLYHLRARSAKKSAAMGRLGEALDGGQAGAPDTETRLPRECIQGWLMVLLQKLDSCAAMCRMTKAHQSAEQQEGKVPLTIGARQDLVDNLDKVQSAIAGGLDQSKIAEGLHILLSRLLQSSHGVLRLLEDVATNSGDSRTMSFAELERFSHVLASVLPVLQWTSAVSPMQSSTSLYEQYAIVLNCLSYLDFEDVVWQQLQAMMRIVEEDGHVIHIVNLLFRTNQDLTYATAGVMKNTAVAKVVLRHVIDSELECLENLSSIRATKVIELLEVVMRRLMEAVGMHHEGRPQDAKLAITHLFPALVELALVVLDRIQGKRAFDGYLTLLRSICKLTLMRPAALYKPLSESLMAHGVTERMLRLMVDILHGPNCKQSLKQRIVEILLMLPCRIEEKIKMDAIVPLMEPLLVAFQSEKVDLVSLAVDVLEHWVDVMKPDFLESRLQNVAHTMLPLLWDLMLQQPYARRIMNILGKLGGRNSSHIRGPRDIENRINNEHGLRLILTFEPSTSFLVPLDRTIQLLTDGQKGLKQSVPAHFRREAFRFLMYGLSCMLNLDLRLAETNASGTHNQEQLAAVLLGRMPDDKGTTTPMTSSKTRLQHDAENNVLKELLTAVLAASVDRDLKDLAEPFNKGVWRHIALLFASGLAKSQSELGVAGRWAPSPSKPLVQSKSNLGQLNMHVALEALVCVLTRENEQCTTAAATATNMFVCTLLDVNAAQAAYRATCPPPPKSPAEPEASAAVKQEAQPQSDGARPEQPGAKSSERAPGAPPRAGSGTQGRPDDNGRGSSSDYVSNLKEAPAVVAKLPQVLDDLVNQVLHACHGETWRSKIGGAAGIGVLLRRLPPAYVKPWATHILMAIMFCLKKVPDHATHEVSTLNGLTRSLLQRTLAACTPVNGGDAASPRVELEGDPDMKQFIDEMVSVLFAQTSSLPMRQAALELMHALAAEVNATPAQIIGPRSEHAILNFRSRCLHSSVMGKLKASHFMLATDERIKKPASHRVVLARRAISTAQAFKTYVSVKPPLFTDPTSFHQSIQDATVILATKDEQLQRMMIANRDGDRVVTQCFNVSFACAEYLCALLLEPAWRDAPEVWADVLLVVEALVPLLCSSKLALAKRIHETLTQVMPKILARPDGAACLKKPIAQILSWISVAPQKGAEYPVPYANRVTHTARLNTVNFLDGLLRVFSVLGDQLPPFVANILMRHLLDWLDPAAMHSTHRAQLDDVPQAVTPALPPRWSRGDHLIVVARICELLSVLPDWTRALFDPNEGAGPAHSPVPAQAVPHPGLLTLTVQLERALHAWSAKSLGGASNGAQLQLWAPLRAPLGKLMLRHRVWPQVLSHSPERPFNMDHFELLRSILLHSSGADLLAAVSADVAWWKTLFQELATRPAPSATDPTTAHTSAVVQLAASVLKMQPSWLAEQPELQPFIPMLWDMPAHLGSLAHLDALSVADRALSHLLLHLMLAYIDACPPELWRFCHLLILYSYPVYINKVPLLMYCTNRFPKVDIAHRSALLSYFYKQLSANPMAPPAASEMLCHVVVPMLEQARKQGELETLVTDEVLSSLMQTVEQLPMHASERTSGDGRAQGNEPTADGLKAFVDSGSCMVELLRSIAIPLRHLPKARWVAHCKPLAQVVWRFLARQKEPVLDHLLLIASLLLSIHVDFSARAPNSSAGRKPMQVYVNLLRAGGPEHDSNVIRQATDALVPLLADTVTAEDRSGPPWINHMRKSLADSSDALLSSGNQQVTSIMAHALGVIVRHADLFYPHMHHLSTQFMTCMSKVAIQPSGSQPYLANHAVELWPIVLDTILCMAYWIRCLLAGQTLVHAAAESGSDRAGGADGAPQVGMRRARELSADLDNSHAPRRRLSEASGDVTRGVPARGPLERIAPVVPGSSEADQRIASAKLSRSMLESLFMLPIRMALQTDRHGPRSKPQMPPTRMCDTQQCARIWARSMHALTSLHELLPGTAIRLGQIIQRTAKDALGPGGMEDSVRKKSILSTLVRVIRIAFRAPGVLSDGYKFLRDKDRLEEVFSSMDMVDDLLPLMRDLSNEAAKMHAAEAETEDVQKKQQLREMASGATSVRSIVMDKVESVLAALRDDQKNALAAMLDIGNDSAGPLALRPSYAAALRLLESELTAGSSVDHQAVITSLPMAMYTTVAAIKHSTEQVGSNKTLGAMIGTHNNPGSFIKTFHTLTRLLQLDEVMHGVGQMAPAIKAWYKIAMGIIMMLSLLGVVPAATVPKEMHPVLDDMFAVIRSAMQNPARLQVVEALHVLKKLAELVRRAEMSNGRCVWASHFEQMVYDICVNKDGAFIERLPEMAFKNFECEHVIGLASADPKLRAAFLDLYDSRIPRTIPERLEFLIKIQTWRHSTHTFWLKRALDLLLCMLKKEQPIALAPNSAQVVSLLGLDQSKAAVMSPLSMRSGSIGLVKLPSVSGGKPTDASLPRLDSLEGLQQVLSNTATPEPLLPKLDEGVRSIIGEHVAFLTDVSRITVNDLVSALTECTEHDDRISYHLWVLVFPVVWQSLQKEKQLAMAKPIISLISRFSEQVVKESNADRNGYLRTRRAVKVVQALMESVTLSQPQPKFPPELIKFLAKNHAAWHIAIPLLETHVIIFPEETRCFHALAELYRLVKEDDLLYGLWKTMIYSSAQRSSAHAIAQRSDLSMDQRLANALTLLQLGRWQEAGESLHDLNHFYQKQYDHAYRATPTQIPPDHIYGKGQLVLEEWISCMKQMNRWEDLYDVARSCTNPQLTVDCEWRLGQWDKLGASLQSNSLQDSAENSIARAYHVLCTTEEHKGLEEHVMRAQARCQQEWSLLPQLCLQPRIQVLQKLVMLVEIAESARLMREVKDHTVNAVASLDASYGTMKEVISSWRLRTPNQHDSLLHWATLIRWRTHVFDFVVKSFDHAQQRNPLLYSLGYRDKSWSVNMLARAARKHGLPMLTNHVINNMYGYPTMEVSEAYAKIREQCKAYIDAPEQQAMGLQLIDNTNLSYFRDEHKAGLFTLKGMLFEAMDKSEEAQQLYYTAIHIKDGSSAPWQRWGEVCANMYDRTHADMQKAASRGQSGSDGFSKEMMDQLKSKQLQYAEQAFACFFKALAFKASIACCLVPRLLCMLAHDSFEAPHPLQQTLCNALLANALPAHCLLPHISYLVEGLMRGERDLMRALLFYLYQSHPQALYLPVRNTAILFKDLSARIQRTQADLYNKSRAAGQQQQQQGGQAGEGAQAAGPGNGSQSMKTESGPATSGPPPKIDPESWPEMFAYEGLKELTELLRSNHRVLLSNMETFINEIGHQCMAKPEERLLSVVYSLLTRAYKIPLPQEALVPEQLKKELAQVSSACYSNEMYHSWRRRGNSPFVPETFRKDIQPHQCKTLQDLMHCLKRWMVTLQGIINTKYPTVSYLEQEFPRLANQDFADLELPGNAALLEYNPSAAIYVERVASNVSVIRRHCASLHRLELICSNGQSRFFTMHGQQNAISSATSFTDNRVMTVFRQVNHLLSNFPQARRRQLQLHAPIMLPIWPSGCLVEEDTCHDTFGNTFETSCARYGRPVDKAILLFKDAVYRQPMPEGQREEFQRRRDAFLEICKKTFMTEQIFSQHMFKSLPSPNHIFAFKKQFCAQLALVSLFSWLFSVQPKAPFKILFSKGSGRILFQEMVPHYNTNAMVGANTAVLKKLDLPYRFTRNLQTFVTPFGTEGWFLITQVLAAQAMRTRKSNLQWVIANFFREDIMLQHRRILITRWQGHPISPDNSVRIVAALCTNASAELMHRLRDISGMTMNKDEMGEIRRARSLQEHARNANYLCKMDAFWQPWL